MYLQSWLNKMNSYKSDLLIHMCLRFTHTQHHQKWYSENMLHGNGIQSGNHTEVIQVKNHQSPSHIKLGYEQIREAKHNVLCDQITGMYIYGILLSPAGGAYKAGTFIHKHGFVSGKAVGNSKKL